SLPENHSTKPGPMRCKALAGALSKEFMGATSTWWDYLWRNFTECLSISVGSQQLQVRRAKPRASTRVVGNKKRRRPAYFFSAESKPPYWLAEPDSAARCWMNRRAYLP